jgi:hypothetical protein
MPCGKSVAIGPCYPDQGWRAFGSLAYFYLCPSRMGIHSLPLKSGGEKGDPRG